MKIDFIAPLPYTTLRMKKEISITVTPADEKNTGLTEKLARKELAKTGIKTEGRKISFRIQKKSVDARHGGLKIHLKFTAYIDEDPENPPAVPCWKKSDGKNQVIIVGSGPAGLFGALKLLEHGIKPVIIERGSETSQRKKDIALISTKHTVNPDCNYCFGEGGAGTFSDGKLFTRSAKRGDTGGILRIFAHFGADPKILTDAHPHIGTDRLPQIISRIRDEITALGGEFHFNTRFTGFIAGDRTVKGVRTENTLTGEKTEFTGDAVLLAAGHSADDIYSAVAALSPESLEAKTFAVGVRAEHPRELIDRIQYHGKTGILPAAEYRLTAQVDGRGVYSFCMCPGGFVVPSATSPDEIVVNGMSSAARNSRWSNAAFVVETRPEDIPAEFSLQAENSGCGALAGLLFRKEIERAAKKHGNGQAAPAQRLTDFLEKRISSSLPQSSYTPGLHSSELNSWLPEAIRARLSKGFCEFGKAMRGFICEDAVLIAAETRTSTPVRIRRNRTTLECDGIQNLYPAGEGSGWSGGIVSSAVDGENSAERIALQLGR